MKVTGVISGDGECWCMQVSEEEFRRINGDADADLELGIHIEMHEEINQPVPEMDWRIYPNDLLPPEVRGKKVTLEVKVIEVES